MFASATVAPPLMNRAGVAMRLGNTSFPGFDGSRTYYCGRRLGRAAIPGSDGQCGPTAGPQCEDCRAAQEALPVRLGCFGFLLWSDGEDVFVAVAVGGCVVVFGVMVVFET